MTPDREEFPGLTRDLGDYQATMDLVRIGHAVHVIRFTLESKDPSRYEILGETLRAVARDLAKTAERVLADHLTTGIVLAGGLVTSPIHPLPGHFVAVPSPPVQDTRMRVPQPAEADLLAQSFASRRRERLTDEDLAEIAEVVERAWAERRPIQAAVADARYVTLSRAGHLIKRARDRGYLPPAPKRARNAQDQ